MKNKVFLIVYYSIIQLNIKKIKNEDLEGKKIIQYLNINSKQHYNKIFKNLIISMENKGLNIRRKLMSDYFNIFFMFLSLSTNIILSKIIKKMKILKEKKFSNHKA